ncbi:uncharacterized protein EV420DRAFT_1767755 [Desarmillaria tabescens]|uniref:Uncharacterized protein n=1 Tax=Armillaria tabescens TaxID=1929756 RepID=A0AA39JPK4_ARMTA|nr:uncharacterized protein EV420DRAFT_1767755 [Desarmillaria tabescens]KAK0446586.1 hypothetical protein EV420DRAFT_1767755 [Desarmillaria tabescens]
MSYLSGAIDSHIEMMDPAQRREYDQLFNETVHLERELKRKIELALSYQLIQIMRSAQDEISRSKTYRQRRSLLRQLAATLGDFRPGIRETFGEDSGIQTSASGRTTAPSSVIMLPAVSLTCQPLVELG